MESSQPRQVIAAGMIGNVLEWYDFAVYGYFATAIGRHFFPHEDAVAQLLSAFGVFAIGYVMRPVGGAVIGHIGDRFGRRTALTFSVAAMAIPTFLIGLLPGYATLGLAAPIALTLLRMVQGLSVGGEYTSSMVFLVEHAPDGRRGVMGALASCGASAGILLGSAVGAGFAASMSDATLDAWGWRIPFLLGLAVGIAGYLLRRHVMETVPAERRKRAPIMETLSDHWRIVLGFAGLSAFNAVSFYVGFVYLVSWLQTADGIAPARALEINSLSMAVLLPVVMATGFLSDRVGRKPLLLLACILGFVGAVPLFLLLNHPSAISAQLGQLGLVAVIGLYGGTQPAIMVEAAPLPVRCTAVALGYNITFGVIGGFTPLAATWLVDRTGDEIAPAFLIMAAAAVTFLTVLRFRETYRSPFIGASSRAAA
ncbi:MAG TPA: MFS transporter, partial [Xanthobacteraceae bacterium]|nr:MFS transporter [Xanthobacteraceae bacterium]